MIRPVINIFSWFRWKSTPFHSRLPFPGSGIKGYKLKKIQMVQKTYFKTKDYCKVKFIQAVDNAETIELFGLNNDWNNSIIMSKKKDGTFTCDVSLPKDSRHEFKYRVNETEWINDPAADAQQPNGLGDTNSVIVL